MNHGRLYRLSTSSQVTRQALVVANSALTSFLLQWCWGIQAISKRHFPSGQHTLDEVACVILDSTVRHHVSTRATSSLPRGDSASRMQLQMDRALLSLPALLCSRSP